MSLLGKLLAMFRGDSTAEDPEMADERVAEPDADAEPDPESEGADEEDADGETADDGPEDVPTTDVAEMADPRRSEDGDNTVADRAATPDDHGDAEAEGESESEGDDEGDDDVPTTDVAEMADPRRSEDEDNTVANRAANPDDQRVT
jgi:hypothetical protein